MLTLERVYQAAHVLKSVACRTDLIKTNGVVDNCDLYLKAENLQYTGSFKLRGAYFKMSTLTEEEKAKGVVACSAGNHAQGVALAAQKSGINATIFLPTSAPISKIEATEKYGAKVMLVGENYDEAYEASLKFRDETNATFLHPFDDEDVIAGQGTIGLEILNQLDDVDVVVIPIGGGGLASGVSMVVKKLNPTCKVYGVQAEGAASMANARAAGELCGLTHAATFADGIQVKKPGENTFSMCNEYVDEVVTVSEDETATAILTLMEKQKIVAEGAGAVSVAAVMFGKIPVEGKKVCAIVSGGNIDVNILSRVINRGMMMSGRMAALTIDLIDKPGQLTEVSRIISAAGGNVTGVHYQPGGPNSAINGCSLRISVETKNHKHLDEVKNALIAAGYQLREDA